MPIRRAKVLARNQGQFLDSKHVESHMKLAQRLQKSKRVIVLFFAFSISCGQFEFSQEGKV